MTNLTHLKQTAPELSSLNNADVPAELLDACRFALRYFELQRACSETLDDQQLDAWDAEMQRMEAEMTPKLRRAVHSATLHSARLCPATPAA